MNNSKNSDFFAKMGENPPKDAQISPNPSNFVAFPSFSLENVSVLQQIRTQIAQNPHYLDLPNCPYAPESKDFLRLIFSSTPIDQAQLEADINAFFGDDEMYERIIIDSKRAYMNLANQMAKMEQGKKLEDAVSYTKALTSMQERLLTIQEKAEGLKKIHEFKRIVMEVIAQELTPDQRTGIITRLEEITKS